METDSSPRLWLGTSLAVTLDTGDLEDKVHNAVVPTFDPLWLNVEFCGKHKLMYLLLIVAYLSIQNDLMRCFFFFFLHTWNISNHIIIQCVCGHFPMRNDCGV